MRLSPAAPPGSTAQRWFTTRTRRSFLARRRGRSICTCSISRPGPRRTDCGTPCWTTASPDPIPSARSFRGLRPKRRPARADRALRHFTREFWAIEPESRCRRNGGNDRGHRASGASPSQQLADHGERCERQRQRHGNVCGRRQRYPRATQRLDHQQPPDAGNRSRFLKAARHGQVPLPEHGWRATDAGTFREFQPLHTDPNGLRYRELLFVPFNAGPSEAGGCLIDFNTAAQPHRLADENGAACPAALDGAGSNRFPGAPNAVFAPPRLRIPNLPTTLGRQHPAQDRICAADERSHEDRGCRQAHWTCKIYSRRLWPPENARPRQAPSSGRPFAFCLATGLHNALKKKASKH